MKKAGIALTGIALVATVLYAVRAPLSTALMGRVLERNMATSLLDTLPDGLNVVLCGAGGPLPGAANNLPAGEDTTFSIIMNNAGGAAGSITFLRVQATQTSSTPGGQLQPYTSFILIPLQRI